jgi:glutamate formiminotransferase / formiminotetrahydrofolate cyclodeaminase
MTKIVECVPNFSEGRDRGVIDAIADAIQHTPGCTLLDVDPGRSTHRTVYTFVGAPEAVVEGALAAARTARKRIDMRQHRGEHPRMGALDVCPFVPVAGVTMAECVVIAESFGRRAAEELDVPIYLYEAAARADHRRSLKQIRAGEYEGLADKIVRPEWQPDFGPARFVPEWGATAAGARFFLIAYNVNVLGTKEQAHRIALSVREQGRGPDAPGRLEAVKGIGWWVEEYGLAQVSMNLDDYTVTPLHAAFEACVEEARALKVAVAGSEIVGLVPLRAILTAADHYIGQEGLMIVEERQKVRLAVERLGLGSVSAFDPAKRIIEYMVPREPDPLADSTVRDFVTKLGARTATPGGGSAAALLAAVGSALGTMVGLLTYGKRQFEAQDPVMRRVIPVLYGTMTGLVPLIDADAAAFEGYRAAAALPQDTDERRLQRDRAMRAALANAVAVPLRVMREADVCWDALLELARHGSIASRSDLEVGAKALEAGIWGAHRNVLTNLADLGDAEVKNGIQREAALLAARAQEKFRELMEVVAVR